MSSTSRADGSPELPSSHLIPRRFTDGVAEVELPTWQAFNLFVGNVMLDYANYIYRGQTRAEWPLESSLDRTLRKIGKLTDPTIRMEHLEQFKFATRGRRGPHPPHLASEDEWWALGQHHGLATPLVDWTLSPYVAAFFAFADLDDEADQRAIYALQVNIVEDKSKAISDGYSGAGRPPIVDVVRPLSNENARLVNQAGLFTRGPDGVDLESWVREQFRGERKIWRLVKILVPNHTRDAFLKNLNRMNINYLTLFPDLIGASLYSNMDLSIAGYSHLRK